MNSRINITLDNEIKDRAMNFAKSKGLSFSALVRVLLAERLEKINISGIEKGLIDLKNGDFEIYSGADYLTKLDKIAKNA